MGFKRIQHGTEILNRSSLAYSRALRKTSCGHLDERLTDCGDDGENSICIDIPESTTAACDCCESFAFTYYASDILLYIHIHIYIYVYIYV